MEQELEKYLQQYVPSSERIKLLAIVTDSSYEVVFYQSSNGKLMQANSLAEEGILDLYKLDQFYREVAQLVRQNNAFQMDKINVLRYESGMKCTIIYKEKGVSSYSIKKEWKKEIM